MTGGHLVPHMPQTRNGHGSEVVDKQVAALKKDGIDISFNMILTRIFRDPTGRVVGIEVHEEYELNNPDSGTIKTIAANKGVVLAFVGFAGDVDFRVTQDPRLTKDYKSTSHRGATAEGLIAALRIDVAPVQFDQIQLIPLSSPDDEGLGDGCGFIAGSGMTHGVLVDPTTGIRFVSELAKEYKIDPDTLQSTVETFKGYGKAKKDPDFDKLIVKAQVLDLNGELIPGLYAAGEITGGIHGGCRLGSVAIIDCLVFGRIAGKNVSAETAKLDAAA